MGPRSRRRLPLTDRTASSGVDDAAAANRRTRSHQRACPPRCWTCARTRRRRNRRRHSRAKGTPVTAPRILSESRLLGVLLIGPSMAQADVLPHRRARVQGRTLFVSKMSDATGPIVSSRSQINERYSIIATFKVLPETSNVGSALVPVATNGPGPAFLMAWTGTDGQAKLNSSYSNRAAPPGTR